MVAGQSTEQQQQLEASHQRERAGGRVSGWAEHRAVGDLLFSHTHTSLLLPLPSYWWHQAVQSLGCLIVMAVFRPFMDSDSGWGGLWVGRGGWVHPIFTSPATATDTDCSSATAVFKPFGGSGNGWGNGSPSKGCENGIYPTSASSLLPAHCCCPQMVQTPPLPNGPKSEWPRVQHGGSGSGSICENWKPPAIATTTLHSVHSLPCQPTRPGSQLSLWMSGESCPCGELAMLNCPTMTE